MLKVARSILARCTFHCSAESEKQGEAPGQGRLGRQSEASQSSSIMGSRDAGPAYGTKKNLILAGLKPAVFGFRRPTPYPLGHRTLHAKPRKDHTECGACRKIKTKEEKMTGGGLNPRPLPALLACLPGDH